MSSKPDLEEMLKAAQSAGASVAAEADDAVGEVEDSSLAAVVALPSYDDMTEQKVLTGVRSVFKGFDHDTKNAGYSFKDMDSLAVYAEHTIEDIREARVNAESNQLWSKAAALARFWYLGETINATLQNAQVGANASNKLAKAMNKSVPYVYQVRAVATKLTVVDCYLMGFRGLDTTHLRRLAQVKDDAVRKAIMAAFVEQTPDTSDPKKLESAKRKLVAAINTRQSMTAEDLGASDPLNGGTEIHVSPEYQRFMDAVDKWQRMMRKPSLEGFVDEICEASENFYIKDDVVDAEQHLDEVKSAAKQTIKILKKVQENLDDIVQSLACMEAVGVTTSEDVEGVAAG